MDTLNEQKPQQEETAAEKANRYMTEEERREWSGIAEFDDPVFRERPVEEKGGIFAIASLICGVSALLTVCTVYLNAIFGAAALICGIISKKKDENASGMSTAGIIMGIIGIGVAIFVLAIWAFKEFIAPSIASNLTLTAFLLMDQQIY